MKDRLFRQTVLLFARAARKGAKECATGGRKHGRAGGIPPARPMLFPVWFCPLGCGGGESRKTARKKGGIAVFIAFACQPVPP